ncbi:MAG: energy transducer TonB [Epsilonproteobacteria bacterium]|nr:energy transducer TonB [Campylobacterota bacterium]
MKRLIPYFLSFSIHLLIFALLVILVKTNDKHHLTADKPIIVDVVTAAAKDKDTIVSRNVVKNLKKVSTRNRLSAGPLTAKKRYKTVQPKGYDDISRRNTKKNNPGLLNSKIGHVAALQKKKPQIYVNKRKESKRAETIHVASINHNSILNTSAKHQSGSKALYSAAAVTKGIKTGSGSFKREAAVSIATKDYRYASYMAHIKRQVESVWIYPEEAIEKGETGVLFLFFVINRNGSLKNIKLINSSGREILDNAAINALKDAAPFPALPKRLNIDRLKVYASFQYNISFDTNIN